MRRRLAELLSEVASRLLELANRLDPETVQLVEELADLAEPAVPATADAELVAVSPSREVAIGLAMRDLEPSEAVIVHNGGPGCTGDAGCGCGAVAYRADRGVA